MQAEHASQIIRQGRLVPWLYVLPSLIVMTTFIVYPGLNTLYLKLRNPEDTAWADATCFSGDPVGASLKTIVMP